MTMGFKGQKQGGVESDDRLFFTKKNVDYCENTNTLLHLHCLLRFPNVMTGVF